MSPRADGTLPVGDCRPLLDDSELYGIGVRVGTYTQWLCTILTVCLVHDQRERVTMRNVNYALAFGEWVVLVNQTRSIWPADAVIVTFLFMGTLTLLCMLEVFDRLRPHKSRRRELASSAGGEMARMVLLAGLIIWAIWWWFEGIYHTLKDCGTYIFYYGGPVRVLGNFKIIGRIWAPLLLIMLIPAVEKYWIFMKARRLPKGEPPNKDGPPVERPASFFSWKFWGQALGAVEEGEPGDDDYLGPEAKQRRGLYCALLLGIGVFILIIFLEIMLAYGEVEEINQISGVGDAVSLVMGCGDMLMILWTLQEQRAKELAKVLFSFFSIMLIVRALLIICQRTLLEADGLVYRYPKTFLYDAEFPLFESTFLPCSVYQPPTNEPSWDV